jgi:hypothetical protein
MLGSAGTTTDISLQSTTLLNRPQRNSPEWLAHSVVGDVEWLVIRQDVAIESASYGSMIASGTSADFLSRVQIATLEQCVSLSY